jgi:pimeloyl-ACP methyl ester carboxylesterase
MDEVSYRRAEAALWDTVGVRPREQRVRLAGTGTTVRVQSVGDGEPVLLVHGGPNAGSTFVPLVPGLLPGRRLLLLDRPGCGLSEPYGLDARSLPGFADRFVTDVLDGLGLDRASVVASSFGGYLALRAAAASPHRVRAMVQLGCPAFVPGMLVPPMMRVLSSPLRHLLTRLAPTERSSAATMVQLGHGATVRAGRIDPALAAWGVSMQRDTDTFAHDAALIARLVGPLRGADPSLVLTAGLLARVTVPTLLLWGADDTFGGPQVAERLRSALPEADLVVLPDSGHLPWFDDAARVAALASDHLDRVTTAA